MQDSFFFNLNKAGLDQLTDPLDYRRVLLVNSLSTISLMVCVVVSILVFLEGLYPQYLVAFGGGLLYLLVLILNRIGKYVYARNYFLVLSNLIVIITSLLGFSQGKFNGIENVLIGFMAVSFFLFDGKRRYLSYLLLFLIFIAIKIIKNDYLGASYDFDFYLTVQNFSILCLLIFLFSNAFRDSLMTAFIRLKAQESLLYSLIDNVPLFIGMVDKDYKYKMVNLNYEKSFGKRREDIIGASVHDVLPPNILKTHVPMLEKVFKGEPQEFLEETKMPDGSSFFAAGKYIPLKNEEGEVIGATVYVDDVTKLEEAKIKLKEAGLTKDRLFSIVAHDIRGPFNLLENILNVSLESLITKEQFFEFLESARSKLQTMKSTVDTLLDWARSQLDGVSTDPQLIALDPIIAHEIELYKNLTEQKGILLKYVCDEDVVVCMDENHLKIATRNLIHNAIKFTSKGGKVSIDVIKIKNRVNVTIADSGVGMDPDRIKSILDKEMQNSKEGTQGEKGSGIGLSLSLGLLEKNKCKIDIKSSVNGGTTFEILIPAG